MKTKLFIEKKYENEFNRSLVMMTSMSVTRVFERIDYTIIVIESNTEDTEAFLEELFLLGLWFERFRNEVK